MRAQFGKVNTLHTHALPTADRPLVTENLVGGEEGLSDAGLSVSQLIQNAVTVPRATGEVFARHVGRVPERRSAPSSTTSAACARTATSPRTSNIDLGTSVAFGPTDVGDRRRSARVSRRDARTSG